VQHIFGWRCHVADQGGPRGRGLTTADHPYHTHPFMYHNISGWCDISPTTASHTPAVNHRSSRHWPITCQEPPWAPDHYHTAYGWCLLLFKLNYWILHFFLNFYISNQQHSLLSIPIYLDTVKSAEIWFQFNNRLFSSFATYHVKHQLQFSFSSSSFTSIQF